MGPYTLRKTDVTPVAEKALAMKCKILDCSLGDPCKHGLGPFPGLESSMRHVRENISAEERHGYTNSLGHPFLREELALNSGIGLTADDVFVGTGSSGVVRAIFEVLHTPESFHIIPEWTYILYLAENARLGKNQVTVSLDGDGTPNIDAIKAALAPGVASIVLTTVGNPLCVGVSRQKLLEIMQVVADAQTRFSKPILLILDPIYEAFRRDQSNRIDCLAEASKFGKIPVVDLWSISKLEASPGSRIGAARVFWPKDLFPEERADFMLKLTRVYLPTLCTVETEKQLAVAHMLHSIRTDETKRKEFQEFERTRRQEVSNRTGAFVAALQDIDGIVFPPSYLRNGKVDLTQINGFYVLFGFDSNRLPRGTTSQASRLAGFCMEKGLHVPIMTPASAFVSESESSRMKQEFIRNVALQDDERRELLMRSIREFARLQLK